MIQPSFGWLDFSERDRRQILDLIDSLNDSEREARDELGLGTIRDAFADLFFPGTSTVQTRARYFLFVPWTYLELESNRTPADRFSAKARKEELDLVEILRTVHHRQEGSIGFVARRGLKRLPSSIYWRGLQTWGICLYQGAQDSYHWSIQDYYASQNHLKDDDGEAPTRLLPNWHPDLPPRPAEFPQNMTLLLQASEAEFLQERIIQTQQGRLLAEIVSREVFAPVRFAWHYEYRKDLPTTLNGALDHAQLFSEAIHSAPLIYNLILAELTDSFVDEYRTELAYWADKMDAIKDEFHQWNRQQFWSIILHQNPQIPTATRSFVNAWLDMLNSGWHDLADNPKARQMVERREQLLKRFQSRIANEAALRQWRGAAGVAQYDYRWRTAQTILLDILRAIHDA